MASWRACSATMRSSSRRRRTSARAPRSNSAGDAVKPARNRLAVADRGRSPGQHQERRLKRVIRIMVIVYQRSAEPPHHRPVPLDQHLKRDLCIGLITVAMSGQEQIKELPIGQAAQRPRPEQQCAMCFPLAIVDVRSIRLASTELRSRFIPIFDLPHSPGPTTILRQFSFRKSWGACGDPLTREPRRRARPERSLSNGTVE